MTLTLKGLRFIAQRNPDLIPDLSVSAITDKGKANMFTKVITCGQALWFGIQCLTRSTQGLSISLLEINTAVHATCALVLYFFFWWNKPLDVEELNICTHEDIHHIAAYGLTQKLSRNPSLFVTFSLVDVDGTDGHEHLNSSIDSETAVPHPTVKHILLRPSRDPKLSPRAYLVYHGFVLSKKEIGCLTALDFQRSKLASKAVVEYGLYAGEGVSFLSVRSRNKPEPSLSSVRSDERPLLFGYSTIGYLLAGLFYGGVHLNVWNRPFRGETDELL